MANFGSVLKLEKVSKIYELGETKVRALTKVSLEINAGEMVAVIGPSGSGKSTLLHLCGLLDKPDEGKIFLDGEDVSTFSENQLAKIRNQKIGFVFQSFNLLSKTSALDNVQLPLVYSGLSTNERRKRAKEVLDLMGLSNRLEHFPSQLSGGEQQRVAIARALSTNPKIILADEPTGNLDSKSGTEILEILRQLHNNGNTIVIITHDAQIAKTAQRIIKIHDGEIK